MVSAKNPNWRISIHAPLTGSDGTTTQSVSMVITISIHAPLTGSDNVPNGAELVKKISIHAPLTGSDEKTVSFTHICPIFQSTLPSQGATANMHIKFLCDLLFSTLSSKNSFTLSRFPQTIT